MPDKIPPPKPRGKKAGTEIGDESGIAIDGIIVNRDYNYKLVGDRAIRIYDEMRKGDATVNVALEAINLPIKAARWRVDPASDDTQDEEIAKFIEDCLFNQPTRTWQETLEEILLYLPYGRMPFELVYEFRADGRIGLRKISPRWPDTIYAWKLKSGEDGVQQKTVNGDFEIPIEKMVIFVNKKEAGNWEGISLLRSAYKHWYMKDKLYLIDAISAERQGLGVPYGKVPTGATAENRAKLEEVLRNMRANEKGFALIEEGMEVGFLDMKASTTKNLMPSIQHHDRQIVKNVLAQFLELGSGGTGSYALSQDQSKLFILSLESVANYIKDCINKYVIKKLVDFNFNVEKYPELMFDKIGTIDHNALTTSLQRLAQIGAITFTDADQAFIRDAMDMPENDGENPVDPALADDILGELAGEMAELSGESATPDAPQEEDPDNPGFDMEGNPIETPEEVATAFEKQTTRDFRATYGDKIYHLLKGGKPGVPLSEETKRKISEALSKGKGKGKKGGKGKNPEVAKKQEEIKKIQQEVKDFNDSVKRELLEMQAKGEKMSPEDAAKKKLEIFDKKKVLSDKISKLRDEISSLKTSSAPAAPAKKSAEEALDQVVSLLDGLEADNGQK